MKEGSEVREFLESENSVGHETGAIYRGKVLYRLKFEGKEGREGNPKRGTLRQTGCQEKNPRPQPFIKNRLYQRWERKGPRKLGQRQRVTSIMTQSVKASPAK